MSLSETEIFGELKRLVGTASREELPRILGAIAETDAAGKVRLTAPQHRDELDGLLTMGEVAARLRVTEETARELGRRGDLPTVRVGGRSVRVRVATLRKYVRDQERFG